LAEHRYGAGRGVDDMVYLTISTGIGAGVISGGRLLHGANGNAGELGHVSVDHRGRRCRCGGIGCLEAYASGTNIAERAGMPSAEDVVAAVRRGERHATAVWSETVELLGAAIASIVNAFNPRRVVLGGGVTRAGDVLFEPVRRIALQRAMPQLAAGVDILTAIANDFGLADVFARQVEGQARPGDVVIGITTSGRSENVVRGLAAARVRGATAVAFTGRDGNAAAEAADLTLSVASTKTARIQEAHTLLVHLVCGLVDAWAVERADSSAPRRPDDR